MTSSHLHAGLPTDRCTAEWWVKSERARAVVEGIPYERPPVVDRVLVPADIAEIRNGQPERARAIQAELAEKLETAFARGLAIVGVERNSHDTVYLLGEAGPKETS